MPPQQNTDVYCLGAGHLSPPCSVDLGTASLAEAGLIANKPHLLRMWFILLDIEDTASNSCSLDFLAGGGVGGKSSPAT